MDPEKPEIPPPIGELPPPDSGQVPPWDQALPPLSGPRGFAQHDTTFNPSITKPSVGRQDTEDERRLQLELYAGESAGSDAVLMHPGLVWGEYPTGMGAETPVALTGSGSRLVYIRIDFNTTDGEVTGRTIVNTTTSQSDDQENGEVYIQIGGFNLSSEGFGIYQLAYGAIYCVFAGGVDSKWHCYVI